ncbi:DNA adenine methylase [Oceanobacillus oncorhynchi]|uniref:DNA adenine methylase n=1 Tax=Oceanobacillus oncorhynchi TaxID=545501 RepID=UPI0039AF190C
MAKVKNPLVKPFLKWAGGKRQLLGYINEYKPREFKKYIEPFVGGGAVFLNLQHKNTIINDFNTELINAYEVVRDNVEELIKLLEFHNNENSSDHYYELRDWDRSDLINKKNNIEKAARFIYLNKTGFNGLFRVNSQNQFNVPYGRYKKPNIVNEEILRVVSTYLNTNKVKILSGDFEEATKSARKGDFIYFDPPYAPLVEDSKNFVGYTLNGFGYEEQVRLRNLFKKLDQRGCYLMMSNSSTDIIHELYAEYAETTVKVGANRSVNSKGDGRGKVDEVIVMNYSYHDM